MGDPGIHPAMPLPPQTTVTPLGVGNLLVGLPEVPGDLLSLTHSDLGDKQCMS